MVQTEAQKRAKAKYYAKLRESEEYRDMEVLAKIIIEARKTKLVEIQE